MALKSTERTLRKCMRKLMREKPFSKITVREICEIAEIGTRTFYRYYSDKYALFEDTYVKDFYIRKDIQVLLYFIENWVKSDFKATPEELKEFIRLSSAVHGKWEYQLATKNVPEEYSLEKFLNNEW